MTGTPALLLDRDGVVNIDTGYIGTQDRFTFMPGIFALTRRAEDLGFRIVIVTNQSGIARGYYSEADFAALTGWMCERLAAGGGRPAAVLYCPFHPTMGQGRFLRDSFWRKPGPGMILEAAGRLRLDLGGSVMVGDQASDIAAAQAAGVGHRVLLRSPGTDPAPSGPQSDGGRSGAGWVVARLDQVVPILEQVQRWRVEAGATVNEGTST